MTSQQGRKRKAPLPPVSGLVQLSPEDTGLSHHHKIQTLQRAPPAHPQCHTCFLGLACAGCLDAPGMEDEEQGRILAARLNADLEHATGAAQGLLLTDCFNPVPSLLDSVSPQQSPFNPKS